MRNISLYLCFILATVHVLADEPEISDTLIKNSEAPAINFANNLDSLLHQWYVQQSLEKDTSLVQLEYETDSIMPEFPDSIYIDRLGKIPALITLSYNRIVRNYIHVYTRKKRDRMEIMLGLRDYYFPMIEEILDREGLPLELKYMAVIESALNPRAVSRAGAVGLWQFMYGTGKVYGLTINSLVDERRDPVRSTIAAAHYLKDLYNIYQDWILVIAAYNCGPGNVNKAIRRSGGVRDYWKIYYRLPRETRGYVPAFVAATYTMNYYREHGLKPVPVEIPLARDTLMIRENLHFRQVSDVLGIPVNLLRDLNPQYRADIVPGAIRPFPLTLPVNLTGQFIDYQDSIFAYKDSVYFDPSKKTLAPTWTSYKPQKPKGTVKLVYTVKPGDNPGYIAEWYHVGLSRLRYWNNIHRNIIRVGQKLVVYVPPSRAEKLRKINQMSFAEKQKTIGKSISASANAQSKPVQNNNYTGDYTVYRVKSGDSIWEIARKFPKITEEDILRVNNLSRSDKIHPGQKLKIPKKT